MFLVTASSNQLQFKNNKTLYLFDDFNVSSSLWDAAKTQITQ